MLPLTETAVKLVSNSPSKYETIGEAAETLEALTVKEKAPAPDKRNA